MSTSREQTPKSWASYDGEDMKPEKKRKAEVQLTKERSPTKSQNTMKNGNTPIKHSSSAPRRNPPSLFTPQRTITIIITSSQSPLSQTFSLHEKLLCYYSSFFSQKLKSAEPAFDANPGPITFHDIDPATFGLFCNWIYYQKIRNEQGKVPGLMELAKLWALGEQIQCGALQNTTMDIIREEVNYPTDFESFIHFAYEMEGEADELRRLAISRLAWTLPGPFKDILGRLPAKAQVDLIMELKDQRDAVPKEYWRDIGAAKDFHVAENDYDEGTIKHGISSLQAGARNSILKLPGYLRTKEQELQEGLDFLSFRQSFVTVIVGEAGKEETFVVHKALICYHSPFMKAAFESDLTEGNAQVMRMEDVQGRSFGTLVHWLYTKEIDVKEEDIIDLMPFDIDAFKSLMLARLWTLARRCVIPSLQNQVMELLIPAM
ncbi:hypothetical protein D0Z07_3841 [Hyphodiscus hymeniophilus]|uniref:BTB domain-containing protein n=1 Tax=Hyphodiscus hymeniophilus TaxID=353542 RepID=A0A9P6VLJ6_9HELO|nr:hypothetical protein D0Z07_3841 [Hyphodiscus hymeniophilus]